MPQWCIFKAKGNMGYNGSCLPTQRCAPLPRPGVKMNKQPIPPRTLLIGLLLYLCFVYFPFIGARTALIEDFIKGDSYYYRAMIISLLHDGDLLLANNIAVNPLDGQLALGTLGLVPKHPVIMPLVSLPFYALLGDAGLLLFNVLQTIILMLLIFQLNRLFCSDILALITTVIYATATLFLDYTYNYSSDIFSTLLVVGGLYCVFKQKVYAGAALLGLAVFAKTPNIPLVGVILAYAALVIWRTPGARGNRLRTIVVMTAIFLLMLVPFAYTNYLLFGSPLTTGYQRAAVAGANDQIIIDDHVNKFNQPFVQGISQTLFDAHNGILPTNPILLLAAVGLASLKTSKYKSQLALILLLCLIQLVFFATYDDWRASHFSNRFLMTFVALSSVFTSAALGYLYARLQRTSPAVPIADKKLE